MAKEGVVNEMYVIHRPTEKNEVLEHNSVHLFSKLYHNQEAGMTKTVKVSYSKESKQRRQKLQEKEY